MNDKKTWSVEQAKHHYRVDDWGLQHFSINAQGNVVAKITDIELDLYELSEHLGEKGVSLPVLVRFPQILQQSLSNLYSAFQQAMKSNHYSGEYIAAYPIKVNQQATVIQHFNDQQQWPIAFEVGSKAELIACLGINNKQQTIICNGYKDEAYIRLALMGCLLGHEIVIIIESLTEFEHVLKQSSDLDVPPKLGMRVRLTSIAKGNWQNSGGEHSKFGLTSNEILALVKQLQENDALYWMQMLHFHMGSQIPCLQDIQHGMQEGMHYFAELAKQGVKFKLLNIGGGLAVDYEGSKSNAYFSMDYSLNEYAEIVIKTVKSSCVKHSLVLPTIFSENGRAMSAYHAVLLTNVIDTERLHSEPVDDQEELANSAVSNSSLNLLKKYIKKIQTTSLNEKDSLKITESYKELRKIIQVIEREFSQAGLSLLEKAETEKLASIAYREIWKVKHVLLDEDRLRLEDKFVAKYFCNFSLFQSTPDIWGLKQIFPVMPLHRLTEYPAVKARIYDLTCDSDGRIDKYVEAGSIQPYLSLHECSEQQVYVLGFFFFLAYQEILGDMHNLFGDTNAVNIVVNADNSYQICDEEPGDTIAEILSYLHIDAGRMRQVWLERLSRNNVSGQDKELVMVELEASLYTNSYLA